MQDIQLPQKARSVHRACSGATKDFYRGIESFAAWLVDNAEGETVTEELVLIWATKAWREGKKRQNVKDHSPIGAVSASNPESNSAATIG